jgi:hypothetical protein
VVGTLIRRGEMVGTCTSFAHFRGFSEEPSSADVYVKIDPKAIASLEGELKRIIDQTIAQKSAEGQLGDVHWNGKLDEKYGQWIDFSIPYPCRWFEDIPDYDRGYADEFRFEVVPRVVGFLRREVLRDYYTNVELSLPHFNPPNGVSHSQVATIGGYLHTKDTRLVPFEISTSATVGWNPEVTVSIRSGSTGGMPPDPRIDQSEIKKLFKPEFLALLGSSEEQSRWHDGMSLGWQGSQPSIWMGASIDYPFESRHLTPNYYKEP